MGDDLTFEFLLDDAEQVEAGALVARRRTHARLWPWLFPVLAAAPFLIAIPLGWPLRTLWTYALILGVAAVMQSQVPRIQRWQTRRMFRESPNVRGPLRYQFSETGLSLQTPISSAELSWDGVQEAVETPKMFVMFIGQRFAYYVPKRAIGSRSPELRAFLRRRLGDRAATIPA
jgi:hypothetical protein